MKLVKTLLLTGENNHDWKRSAPYCKNLLEESKKFEVDLTTDPSVSLTDKDKLSDYNLFFVDYNGPQWVDPAKENFRNFFFHSPSYGEWQKNVSKILFRWIALSRVTNVRYFSACDIHVLLQHTPYKIIAK